MYDTRLKRCPFCGATANIRHWRFGYIVECDLYDARTHRIAVDGRTKDEAIRLWNTRVEVKED